jgi:transcriptional regulator with XRE-family HTH domain
VRRIHGPALKAIRIARGLDQYRLADLAQVHDTHVSRLERGLRQPTPFVLSRLAAALRVRPTLLTGQVPLIKWLRERNKFTPDEFAAAIDVTVDRLAALEAGAAPAGPVELEAMARVLDVDPAALTRRVTDAA